MDIPPAVLDALRGELLYGPILGERALALWDAKTNFVYPIDEQLLAGVPEEIAHKLRALAGTDIDFFFRPFIGDERAEGIKLLPHFLALSRENEWGITLNRAEELAIVVAFGKIWPESHRIIKETAATGKTPFVSWAQMNLLAMETLANLFDRHFKNAKLLKQLGHQRIITFDPFPEAASYLCASYHENLFAVWSSQLAKFKAKLE